MAKGKLVEKLTERALRQAREKGSGRAKSGPWLVGVDESGTYLQHYGYTVATYHQGSVRPRAREGHGISMSDGDGIRAFGRGLGNVHVEEFKRNPRAYSDRPRERHPSTYPDFPRQHHHAHSAVAHHIGPCDPACRMGLRRHEHRRAY